MRRAALAGFLVFGLAFAIAMPAARASCADDVRADLARLPQVKDPAHRKELTLLLDKAAKDAAAGRERLCRDDLVRAQGLYR